MAKSPMPFFPGDQITALEDMDDVYQGGLYVVDRVDYEERPGWMVRLDGYGSQWYDAKYFVIHVRGQHFKPMSSMVCELLKTVPRKKAAK